MKTNIVWAVAVLVGSGMGAAAFGSSVPVTANLSGGVAPGSQSLKLSFTGGAPTGQDYVGQINWSMTSTQFAGDFPTSGPNAGANSDLKSIVTGANNTFSTYCIEGTEDVIIGNPATWNDGEVGLGSAPDPGDLNATFTATQQTDLANLWNLFYDVVGAATGQTQNNESTAFQLAIWEIADDAGGAGGLGADSNYFTSGVFRAAVGTDATNDPLALSQATTWLNQIKVDEAAHTVVPASYLLFAVTDKSAQDQLFGVPIGGGTTGSLAPLPAALPAGLALMAALGFGKVIRRRLGH